jgi:protein-S-isoprenylcysteine O-methyltransferase Ste14
VALGLHGVVFGFNAPLGLWFGGGVLLMAAGLVWAAWARRCLREADTPLTASAQPVVLVDEGPYRYGRNPMALGSVLTMLGIGLAAGVPFMAIAALNWVVIVNSVHIPLEEAQLQRAFGGWYSDYAASVRRWF